MMDLRAGGISHRNKMVILPSSFRPQLTGGPSPLPHPQRGLTLDPHPVSHKPGGGAGVEGTGPRPLGSRFFSQPSSHPSLSPQQKPETLLGKRLRVEALPPPLSSPPPISSYPAPSRLPLLLNSSNSAALSHYRICHSLALCL